MAVYRWDKPYEETPPLIRRALCRLLCSTSSDEAWRLYSLLDAEGPMEAWEISRRLGIGELKARRILWDLERLGLVSRRRRGASYLWGVETRVDGILRENPYSGPVLSDSSLVTEMASLLSWLSGADYITYRTARWILKRNGMLEYIEKRRMIKLSASRPPLSYATLIARGDRYSVEIEVEGTRVNPYLSRLGLEGGMELVIARIPEDIVERARTRTPIGGVIEMRVRDHKRLAACPSGRDTYAACFPMPMAPRNVFNTGFTFEAPEPIRIVGVEVSADGESVARLQGRGRWRGPGYMVELEPRLVRVEARRVRPRWLDIIVFLSPRYRSYAENWLLLGGKSRCDPCGPLKLQGVEIY